MAPNDGKLDSRIRMIRDHGQTDKYYHEIEGYNGRCDELQAAALRVKLRHLPAWNEARRKHSRLYFRLLQKSTRIIVPKVENTCLPVFHLLVVQVEKRDSVRKALRDIGICTGIHYPVPLHLQRAYQYLRVRSGTYPITEACSKRILSLPMYPGLTEDQVRSVCRGLLRIVDRG